jgi:hypothetical protein
MTRRTGGATAGATAGAPRRPTAALPRTAGKLPVPLRVDHPDIPAPPTSPRKPMKTSLRRTLPLLSLSLVLPLFVATTAAADATAVPASPVAAPPADLPTITPDELVRGQKGYGLTVLSGSEPVRFEVEVIGVMRNMTPGDDLHPRPSLRARHRGHRRRGWHERQPGVHRRAARRRRRLRLAVLARRDRRHHPDRRDAPGRQCRRWDRGTLPASGAPPPATLAELVSGEVPHDLLARSLERWRPSLAGGALPGIQWSLAGFGDSSRALLAASLGAVAPAGMSLGAAGGGEAVADLPSSPAAAPSPPSWSTATCASPPPAR